MLMLLRSVKLASSANTALYHFSTIIHFPFYPHTPWISNKNRKLIIQCRNTFLLSLRFVCFFCCTSSTSLTISRRFTLLSSSFSLHLSALNTFFCAHRCVHVYIFAASVSCSFYFHHCCFCFCTAHQFFSIMTLWY